MDGPSRTINPACVQPHRAQTSKGLGKTPSRVQALLWDSAASEPRHTLPWTASWKSQCSSKLVQMFVKANSKPHDIVTYMGGSVTRDWFGWQFTFKQGGRTTQRQWCPESHDLQSDHGGRSSHTCNTVASLPMWRTDYTCHHSQL